MKKALAVILAVLLVLAMAACQVSDPTSSAAPTESSEKTEAPTTVEPTTAEPASDVTTQEAPSEEKTTEPEKTEEPTTEEPTTEPPTTEPEKISFRTGLYQFKAGTKLVKGELGSSSFFFNESGQFDAEFSYSYDGWSEASYYYGSYVVDGDTVYCYCWFAGGSGGVGSSANMYDFDVLKIQSDTTLTSDTVDKGKTIEFKFSTDKEETMRRSFDSAPDIINNKYISNQRYEGAPGNLETVPCTELYTFPGRNGRLLGSAELGLYEDGRFCLSDSFTDGAGGGSMIGNYVRDDEHIRCYVWFSQAGDPVYYATSGSLYDFWIMEDGRLLLKELVDTYYLYFEKSNDQSRMNYFTSNYDIRRIVQYGYIDYTPKD